MKQLKNQMIYKKLDDLSQDQNMLLDNLLQLEKEIAFNIIKSSNELNFLILNNISLLHITSAFSIYNEISFYLIDCGFDINLCTSDTHKYESFDWISGALKNFFRIPRNVSGISPIIIASKSNNIQLVQKLVSHGANLKQRTSENTNVLIEACSVDDFELVKLLYNLGCETKISKIFRHNDSNSGYNLLDIAILRSFSDTKILELTLHFFDLETVNFRQIFRRQNAFFNFITERASRFSKNEVDKSVLKVFNLLKNYKYPFLTYDEFGVSIVNRAYEKHTDSIAHEIALACGFDENIEKVHKIKNVIDPSNMNKIYDFFINMNDLDLENKLIKEDIYPIGVRVEHFESFYIRNFISYTTFNLMFDNEDRVNDLRKFLTNMAILKMDLNSKGATIEAYQEEYGEKKFRYVFLYPVILELFQILLISKHHKFHSKALDYIKLFLEFGVSPNTCTTTFSMIEKINLIPNKLIARELNSVLMNYGAKSLKDAYIESKIEKSHYDESWFEEFSFISFDSYLLSRNYNNNSKQQEVEYLNSYLKNLTK